MGKHDSNLANPFYIRPYNNDPQHGATYEQHLVGGLNRFPQVGTTPQQPSMNTVYAANQQIGGQNHVTPLREGGDVIVKDAHTRVGHNRFSQHDTRTCWSNIANNFVGVALITLAVGAAVSLMRV